MDENFKDRRFQNPHNQIKALKEYSERQGHVVVAEYIDRLSGADPNRPAFKQMFSQLRQFKVEAVLVWKLDRFSREPMLVILGYIRKLKIRNVGIISTTESWLDTTESNPTGDLIIAIMAWFCGEERRKISERTKLGIEAKKAEGTWKGGRPKGSKDKKARKRRGYFLKKRGA